MTALILLSILTDGLFLYVIYLLRKDAPPATPMTQSKGVGPFLVARDKGKKKVVVNDDLKQWKAENEGK